MDEIIKGLEKNRPEYRLMRLMKRLKHLRLGDFPHSRYDVTFSQMELIRFVGNHPGCHLQDIAEGLDLTSATVSVGIRRLVEEGWIERNPDPQDGRAACLHLTPESEEIFQKAAQAMVLGMRTFIEQLTSSEQEQLFGLLEKAIQGVEAGKSEVKKKIK